MSQKPVALVNDGSICYLNSGIQAISSCNNFVQEIRDLNEKLRLEKLSCFYNLINFINNGGDRTNISSNPIFCEWNKPGQQDSFELLSHLINQVFSEIRSYKVFTHEILERNLNEWLKVKLPLRIIMKYNIKCNCNVDIASPGQSDIALHLTFRKRASKDEPLLLQGLLDDHFKVEEIFDFKCNNDRCDKSNAARKLKLCLPLPNTICIHLQRLFWNGKKMKKIDDNVVFCNRITISKDCLTSEGQEEDIGDVHYYLRSVIVHSGGESCGHYICYKKFKNSWFYTSDSSVYEVNGSKVFEANPYILFYETTNVEEVFPMTAYKSTMGLVIHGLASCRVFLKYLKKIAPSIPGENAKRLIYLTDVTNGNVNRRKVNVFNDIKKDDKLHHILMTFLDGIISEITRNHGRMFTAHSECRDERNQETLIFKIRYKKYRKWNILKKKYEFEKFLDITTKDTTGPILLPQILEDYFGVTRSKDKEFSKLKYVFKCLETIIFYLKGLFKGVYGWSSHNARFVISYQITLPGCGPKMYYLKAVIGRCFRVFSCVRLMNGYWYHICGDRVRMVSMTDVLGECVPYILFYDSREEKLESDIYLSRDSVAYNDALNFPLNYNKSLTNIVSSFYFIKNKVLKLLEINNSKKVQDSLSPILSGHIDMERLGFGNKPFWLARKITCECGFSTLSPVEGLEYLYFNNCGTSLDLQMMLKMFFKKELIDGHVCDTDDCQSEKGFMQNIFCRPFPEAISIQVQMEGSRKIQFSKKVFIKNENFEGIQDSNSYLNLFKDSDISFILRTVITTDNAACYRDESNSWVKVTNDGVCLVSEETFFSYNPSILFFELEVDISTYEYINIILQCLSSSIQLARRMQRLRGGVKKEFQMKLSKHESKECKILQNLGNNNCSALFYILLKKVLYYIENESVHGIDHEREAVEPSPWKFSVSSLISCSCGSSILKNKETKVTLDISVTKRLLSSSLQSLIDSYFKEEHQSRHCYNTRCTSGHCTRRLLLHHPLPKLIFINLKNSGEVQLELFEDFVIKGQFCGISGRDTSKGVLMKSFIFRLRSAIVTDECLCYKKVDGKWLPGDVMRTDHVECLSPLSRNPCILLFERDGVDEEGPFEVQNLKPKAEYILNLFTQSFTPCVKFCEWLKKNTSSDNYPVERRTLLSLMKDDINPDYRIVQKWSDDQNTDIIGVFERVLRDVIDHDDIHDPPVVIFNCTGSSCHFQSNFIRNIALPFNTDLDVPETIQDYVDQSVIDECLPSTVCFIFDHSNPLIPSKSIFIKNNASSSYGHYFLMSFVDVKGSCVRRIDLLKEHGEPSILMTYERCDNLLKETEV